MPPRSLRPAPRRKENWDILRRPSNTTGGLSNCRDPGKTAASRKSRSLTMIWPSFYMKRRISNRQKSFSTKLLRFRHRPMVRMTSGFPRPVTIWAFYTPRGRTMTRLWNIMKSPFPCTKSALGNCTRGLLSSAVISVRNLVSCQTQRPPLLSLTAPCGSIRNYSGRTLPETPASATMSVCSTMNSAAGPLMRAAKRRRKNCWTQPSTGTGKRSPSWTKAMGRKTRTGRTCTTIWPTLIC